VSGGCDRQPEIVIDAGVPMLFRTRRKSTDFLAELGVTGPSGSPADPAAMVANRAHSFPGRARQQIGFSRHRRGVLVAAGSDALDRQSLTLRRLVTEATTHDTIRLAHLVYSLNTELDAR
jgi:hypothetical protein